MINLTTIDRFIHRLGRFYLVVAIELHRIQLLLQEAQRLGHVATHVLLRHGVCPEDHHTQLQVICAVG